MWTVICPPLDGVAVSSIVRSSATRLVPMRLRYVADPCDDDALAEPLIEEAEDRAGNFRPRPFSWDQLAEVQVARRVEEVRAEEVRPKVFREPFGDGADGDAARVRRDYRAGPPVTLDLLEQLSFDVEVFDDGFDDEVAVFQLREVILEVADRDEARAPGREERGGPGLLRRFESGARDAVARLARVGWALRPSSGSLARGESSSRGAGRRWRVAAICAPICPRRAPPPFDRSIGLNSCWGNSAQCRRLYCTA